MHGLLDTEEEIPDTRDREISLGTGMLLGIFFGLALVCAGFFGFGYLVGSKQAQGPSVTHEELPGMLGSVSKPAPGRSTLDAAQPTASAVSEKSAGPASVTIPYTPPEHGATIERHEPAATSSSMPTPGQTLAVQTGSSPVAATSVSPTPAAVPGMSYMVQIAAVTHQEDADMLLSALKNKGYAVAIHSEPQDRFMHVQVGPFSNRKDADAMRQKLLNDGFNAIVK
jgi:DedD protein